MPIPLLASRRARLLAVAAVGCVAASLPIVADAQVQSVTVVGYVTDTSTAPIPAAEVRIVGTPFGARTDEKGAFRLTGLAPGQLTVLVRRLGFRARTEKFDTRAGDTLQLMIDLTAIPAELAGETVTGKQVARRSRWLDEFDDRRARGFGSFMTRAEIEKRNPLRTSDLFRTISGVTVIPNGGMGEVRMARSMGCAPDIYIDGLEARGFRVDDIPPVDIAGIEVFHGPSETPVRFRRLWAGCGVVSIWTRPPGS